MTPVHDAAPRWPVYLVGLLALCAASVAVPSAVGWYGQPVASVLVGPNAVVSSISGADWDGPRQGLKFPDRIVSVQGVDLRGFKRAGASNHLNEMVREAAAAGQSELAILVEQKGEVRQLTVAIQRLDPITWWLVAGSLFFSGALYVTAGMIALWVNPRGRLSRTFGTLAPWCGLFMFSTFDYHTSCHLVPLFYLCFALVPGKLCMLALRLPDDAPVLQRLPWLERATTGAGLVIAGAFLLAYYAGFSTVGLQVVWTSVFGASGLFFVVTFIVRFALSEGRRRRTLRALVVSMVPPHAVVGGFMALRPLTRWAAFGDTIMWPAMALVPISTAFAFVRYDLWGSRTLLSRLLTKLVIGALACAIAAAAATGIMATLGVPFHVALMSAALGAAGAAVLVLLALNATERLLFPSRAQYKPTVEQLSEQLTSLTSPPEVARAIERTVGRWLPCEQIHLSLADDPGPPSLRPSHSGFMRAANPAAPGEPADAAVEVVVPVSFGGRQLGILELGAKLGGALYTSDDMDLLHTIANQGALALAHARAYQELEQRRRQQAAAWRGERAALVETVAAEIAHEIRYPLNYFRSLFDQAAGRPLDSEDVEVGREEVERLERLVGELRRLAVHRLQRKRVSIQSLCARAELLLRDALGNRELVLAGDPNLSIRCDVDQATQILVNLLANALQAANAGEPVGVSWQRDGAGATLTVWDQGPGFVGDPAELFAPWYTTKDRGTGLGLAITHRLVRSHGWTIQATRADGVTSFTVCIQQTDVVKEGEVQMHHKRDEVA